jgi:hypothetical protein
MNKFNNVSGAANFSCMNGKPNTPEDCYCVGKPPVATHSKSKNGNSTCI